MDNSLEKIRRKIFQAQRYKGAKAQRHKRDKETEA